ncbi:MAG: hypothetical protein ACRD0U_09280, partial [Acidimicrobiales bacterium]
MVLRLFPAPGSPAGIPAEWLDVAAAWVAGTVHEDDVVRLRILTVQSQVPTGEVAGFLHECRAAKAWCDAVAGDLDEHVRAASMTFGRLPHLALGAGGPAYDPAALLEAFEQLRDMGRELASTVAYACLDFEPTFEGLALALTDESSEPGAPTPNEIAAMAAHRFAPGAYPWQVLGPDHRAHAARAGFRLPGEPLGDGRIEVAIDSPQRWLSTAPARVGAKARGRDLLGPLLATAADVAVIAQTGAPGADGDVSLPELDAVVLEPTPHAERGNRLTVMELAAWLAQEPHSDQPSAVSPVVGAFARWLAAGLDDDRRQRLTTIAPRMVGTSGDADDDRARRWMAAHWLVTRATATALRLAGLVATADQLSALASPRPDDGGLDRAIDLLGSAATVTNRRIDVTRSIIGDTEQGSTDELDTWGVWERFSESTGLSAAVEAATNGSPSEVGYSADGQVAAGTRTEQGRAEIERSGTNVGAMTWAAVLGAVGDDIWDRGWRAADQAVRDLTGSTLRIKMGWAAKTLTRTSFDEDALDHADRAGRVALAEVVARPLVTPAGRHPWEAAMDAARVAGGPTWTAVLDHARQSVGDEAWTAGMADAGGAVSSALAGAP